MLIDCPQCNRHILVTIYDDIPADVQIPCPQCQHVIFVRTLGDVSNRALPELTDDLEKKVVRLKKESEEADAEYEENLLSEYFEFVDPLLGHTSVEQARFAGMYIWQFENSGHGRGNGRVAVRERVCYIDERRDSDD